MPKGENKLPDLVVGRIVELSRSGLPDRRVAKLLDIAKTTVGTYRRESGIAANGHALQTKEAGLVFTEGKAPCRWCLIPKSSESFRVDKNVCADCENERQTFHLHTNLKRYFNRKAAIARDKAKKDGLAFDLTGEALLMMYEAQNRLCFYTDRPMNPNAGRGKKRKSVSIDKIVPSLGYVLSNTVLCTTHANLIKNDQTLDELKEWGPLWYARLEAGGYVPKSIA